MSFYKLIAAKLSEAGLDYNKKQLIDFDIIEYMVLEAVGALDALQGKPLKCIYRSGHTTPEVFQDTKKRSTLEFGLKDAKISLVNKKQDISPEKLMDFLNSVTIIENIFPDSSEDFGHRYYNKRGTLYAVVMLNDDIEHAIRTSSVFKAADDLSQFDLESLLMLIEKLNLYKIADNNVTTLVTRLADRVNTYIRYHFDAQAIQKAQPKVQKMAATALALSKNKLQFNALLNRFNTFEKLAQKGKKAGPHEIDNENYNPDYVAVAEAATLLKTSLFQARDDFFNNSISEEGFKIFKKTCLDAIHVAKIEFAKFRGWGKWYSDLHPVLQGLITCLKAMAGIIAAITIVPAVLTEVYAKEGYVGTFFNTKTNSLKKLETLERAFIKDSVLWQCNQP